MHSSIETSDDRRLARAASSVGPGRPHSHVGAPVGGGRTFFFVVGTTCEEPELATGARPCPRDREYGSVVWSSRSGRGGACPGNGVRGCVRVAEYRAPAPHVPMVASPRAADGDRVVIDAPPGVLEVRTARGALVGRHVGIDHKPRSVALTGDLLVTQQGRSIRAHQARTGELLHVRAVPAGAVLFGAERGLALVRDGRRFVVLRLRDGRSAAVRVPGRARPRAALGPADLFYGHGRTAVHIPLARLLARLR